VANRDRLPYAVGFLNLNTNLRLSCWQGEGNSKPDSLNRSGHVLAFNPVITWKLLTPDARTHGTDFFTFAADAPTRDVKRSPWSLPVDGIIKPPVISALCARDLLTEHIRMLGCASEERQNLLHLLLSLPLLTYEALTGPED